MAYEHREEKEDLTPEDMLGRMQRQPNIIKNRLPAKKKWMMDLLTNKIPLLAGFLRSSNSSLIASSTLAHMKGDLPAALQSAGPGLHFVNLGTAAIDFFRIPAIYLMAAINGETPPISISKNARWLYSAALIGLTVATILIPTLAPILAFAIAGLALSFSLVSMGNQLYQRFYAIPKQIAAVDAQIKKLEKALVEIGKEAKALGKRLQKPEDYETVAAEITKKHEEYQRGVNLLQKLQDDKTALEKKRQSMGKGAFLNRGVAIVIASTVLIGLVTALFFPPLGVGIVAAAAGSAALYVAARVIHSLLEPRFNKWFGKEEKTLVKENKEPVGESTTLIVEDLNGHNPEEVIKSLKIANFKEEGGLLTTITTKQKDVSAEDNDESENKNTEVEPHV